MANEITLGRIFTYRFRIRDKHAARLDAQARAVNFVWNYCNEVQRKAAQSGRQWTTANQLGRLCSGATKEGLDLRASTVEQICRQYDRSRRQKRKPWLRWRGRKSLGWIPVKDKDLVFRDGAFWFRRERYDAWITRALQEGQRFGCSPIVRQRMAVIGAAPSVTRNGMTKTRAATPNPASPQIRA